MLDRFDGNPLRFELVLAVTPNVINAPATTVTAPAASNADFDARTDEPALTASSTSATRSPWIM
jgi:hypothetical protein